MQVCILTCSPANFHHKNPLLICNSLGSGCIAALEAEKYISELESEAEPAAAHEAAIKEDTNPQL